MKRLLLTLVGLSLAVSAMGQPSDAKPAHTPDTKLFASSQQSAEMKKLVDNFAGSWRTTISTHKPWFPQEATAKGRADISSGPAGNSVHENFRSFGPLGSFAGRGAYWWDAPSSSYQGIWCDSMDPRGCGPVGKGAWEGDKLIYNNEIDMEKGKLRIRETFSNITKDSFDFLIEAANGTEPLTPMLSIRYERDSSRPRAEKK